MFTYVRTTAFINLAEGKIVYYHPWLGPDIKGMTVASHGWLLKTRGLWMGDDCLQGEAFVICVEGSMSGFMAGDMTSKGG